MIEDREFSASVLEYLTLEKAYPRSELQVEATIGSGADGRHYRVDLAVLDSRRSEIVALIEMKRYRERQILRSAISQLLHYRRVLDKPYIPLYLFFVSLPGSGKRFEIAQVLPDGDTKEIYPHEFPSYDTLLKSDKSSKKAARTAAVRATVDTFQFTCVGLSVAVAIVLGLDTSGLLELTTKQLALAGVSGALLVLPFAAKFKMLGVEFKRHIPTRESGDDL